MKDMQTTTISPAGRRVIVVVGEYPGADHPDARRVTGAVTGADVLLVAPAGPVAGETWVVDRTAREAQARARLGRWAAALAPHARSLDGEIGDPEARRAVADARLAHAGHTVITTTTAAARAPRRPWVTALAGRLTGTHRPVTRVLPAGRPVAG